MININENCDDNLEENIVHEDELKKNLPDITRIMLDV